MLFEFVTEDTLRTKSIIPYFILRLIHRSFHEISTQDFGRDRFSSVGQLDIGSAVAGTDEHIEIDDNSIKVRFFSVASLVDF